jgi:hypothetical protein
VTALLPPEEPPAFVTALLCTTTILSSYAFGFTVTMLWFSR